MNNNHGHNPLFKPKPKDITNFYNLLERLKQNKPDLRVLKKENGNQNKGNNNPSKSKLKDREKDYSTISYRDEQINAKLISEEPNDLKQYLGAKKNRKYEDFKHNIGDKNNLRDDSKMQLKYQNYNPEFNKDDYNADLSCGQKNINKELEVIIEQSDTIRCTSQNYTNTLTSQKSHKNIGEEIPNNSFNMIDPINSNSKYPYPKHEKSNSQEDSNKLIPSCSQNTSSQIHDPKKNPNSGNPYIKKINHEYNKEQKTNFEISSNDGNEFSYKYNNKIMNKNLLIPGCQPEQDLNINDSNSMFFLKNSYEENCSNSMKNNLFFEDSNYVNYQNSFTECNSNNNIVNQGLHPQVNPNIINNNLLINNNFFIEHQVPFHSDNNMDDKIFLKAANNNKNNFNQGKIIVKNKSISNISGINMISTSAFSDLNLLTNRTLTNRDHVNINYNNFVKGNETNGNNKPINVIKQNKVKEKNPSISINNSNNFGNIISNINTFRSTKNNSISINANKDVLINVNNNVNKNSLQDNNINNEIKNSKNNKKNKIDLKNEPEKAEENPDTINEKLLKNVQNQVENNFKATFGSHQFVDKNSISKNPSNHIPINKNEKYLETIINNKKNPEENPIFDANSDNKKEKIGKIILETHSSLNKSDHSDNVNINRSNIQKIGLSKDTGVKSHINLDENFYELNHFYQNNQINVGKSLSKIEEYKQIPYEYLQDIFENLLMEEREAQKQFGYLKHQTDLNERMRAILVDWIIEVHYKFKLFPETLFLTVSLIDRFLFGKQIDRENLQLVGIAAMLIACKYEEIYSPELRDFVYISENTVQADDILKMESEMLKILKFEICFPSINRFYEILAILLNFSDKEVILGKFLSEIFLMDYRYTKYSSSLIASAVCYLVKKDERKSKLKDFLELAQSDLINFKECVKDICFIIEHMDKIALKAVRKKYATVENHQFARIKLLDLL